VDVGARKQKVSSLTSLKALGKQFCMLQLSLWIWKSWNRKPTNRSWDRATSWLLQHGTAWLEYLDQSCFKQCRQK